MVLGPGEFPLSQTNDHILALRKFNLILIQYSRAINAISWLNIADVSGIISVLNMMATHQKRR
jgi:hypothetical protein